MVLLLLVVLVCGGCVELMLSLTDNGGSVAVRAAGAGERIRGCGGGVEEVVDGEDSEDVDEDD